MANQSDLTIGGIGGDPSGSHPIGNLNVNWTQSLDDKSMKYTANTIMADVAAGTYHTGTTANYYSDELCVGTLSVGTALDINDTGNAQLKACWQYYKPANGNNFNSGNEVVPGTAANLDAGTWTDIGTPLQNYTINVMSPYDHTIEDAMENGITRLRVKLVATDADGDGITHTLINAAVAAVNSAYVLAGAPDKQAKKNDTINNPVTFGGIGADPS
tara:strand:- start:5121 stop:5768 length:648 start_codon:yes stop_codon:yes gene_type:complete